VNNAATTHNKTVTASPPNGGSGFGRLGHGYAIPTPPSPTFGRAVFASQSPYMPAQTSVTAKTLHENFFTPNSSSLRAILGAGALLQKGLIKKNKLIEY